MYPNTSLSPPTPTNGQSVDTNYIFNNIYIVLYTLTVALGTTGNSAVIWVAGFKLKPNVTNVWLVNLAVADLIFCFTRALSLTKKFFFDHWPFGVFLCKFNGFFKYANMFCSVFLLAVISLDRAFSAWKPHVTKRRRTLRAARLVALCVWTTAVILSSPYYVYRTVYPGKNNMSKCSVGATVSNNSIKQALYLNRFLCGFLLPFIVILVSYVLAGIRIGRTRLSGKSRPLRMLACLVVAFFVCWAPYHCLQLVKMVDKDSPVVKSWHPLASGVAYFNSCVNPLLYFCMGLNTKRPFRQSLAAVYKRALAEDDEGHTSQSNDRSLDDSMGSRQYVSGRKTSVF